MRILPTLKTINGKYTKHWDSTIYVYIISHDNQNIEDLGMISMYSTALYTCA